MKEHENIYWAARMRAAERAPIFSSRERTAAALYISTDTLRDIERGISAAPCDVVQKMCELYEDPDLKAQHIRAVCPLLADYGGSGYGELALAALNWAGAACRRSDGDTAICRHCERRAHQSA